MNCWHCGTELIWGGDHDMEDNEEYDIITNLSCPNCHSAVDVYHPSEQLVKEYKKHKRKEKNRYLKIMIFGKLYQNNIEFKKIVTYLLQHS